MINIRNHLIHQAGYPHYPHSSYGYLCQNDVIYLQTIEGDIIPFPKSFVSYSNLLHAQVLEGKGIRPDNPIPIQCNVVSVTIASTDLDNLVNRGIAVPVESYDENTLQQLSTCTSYIGIDFLAEAYTNEYEQYRYAKEVFNDLKQIFAEVARITLPERINTIIMNLYLVITNGRRGFLWDGILGEEAILDRIQFVAEKYRLNVGVKQERQTSMLITKEPIDFNQFNNNMYLAQILDYGCIDPNWNDIYKPRIVYYLSVQGDTLYRITQFVCTIPHRVPDQRLQELIDKLQKSVSKINPAWKVILETKEVPAR